MLPELVTVLKDYAWIVAWVSLTIACIIGIIQFLDFIRKTPKIEAKIIWKKFFMQGPSAVLKVVIILKNKGSTPITIGDIDANMHNCTKRRRILFNADKISDSLWHFKSRLVTPFELKGYDMKHIMIWISLQNIGTVNPLKGNINISTPKGEKNLEFSEKHNP
jgi:hypothetical protein